LHEADAVPILRAVRFTMDSKMEIGRFKEEPGSETGRFPDELVAGKISLKVMQHRVGTARVMVP
jgi:hypothetical protein